LFFIIFQGSASYMFTKKTLLDLSEESIKHLESLNIDLVKFKNVKSKVSKTHSSESLLSQNYIKSSIKRKSSSVNQNKSMKSIENYFNN